MIIEFKTHYAVCVQTYIDGAYPGAYTVAICETEEDTKIIKGFVDSCLKTINNVPEDTRRHEDAYSLIYDAVEASSINTKFGAAEGVAYGRESYISTINIIEKGQAKGFPTRLNHWLRDYRRRMREEFDEERNDKSESD